MSLDPVELLAQLVAIPSVSPMGREVSGAEYLETRLTEFLVRHFQRLGVPYEVHEVMPGRANVIARLDVPGAESTLLLDAHQDTVPVDGMVIPPFTPEIRDGRLYGRGACDVKGGMAAMLTAFARLAADPRGGRHHVVMSCTCDEESTAQGVRALSRLWSEPGQTSRLLAQPPDLAVVAEPTGLDLVVAHKGAVRWKIRTRGRACHSSRPNEGVNAIYGMGEVLRAVEELARELPGMVPAHPLCGVATLSVGRIEGGISVNTVPDECFIEIDRRVLPTEVAANVIPQVEQWLRARVQANFEMLPPWIDGATLSDHNNGPWADRLLAQVTPLAGPRQKLGAWYGTNASRIAVTGVPAVVFGPGSIEQAHTRDEWIELEQLRLATEILHRFCRAG